MRGVSVRPLLVAFCMLVVPVSATFVENGGFETGDLTGWELRGNPWTSNATSGTDEAGGGAMAWEREVSSLYAAEGQNGLRTRCEENQFEGFWSHDDGRLERVWWCRALVAEFSDQLEDFALWIRLTEDAPDWGGALHISVRSEEDDGRYEIVWDPTPSGNIVGRYGGTSVQGPANEWFWQCIPMRDLWLGNPNNVNLPPGEVIYRMGAYADEGIAESWIDSFEFRDCSGDKDGDWIPDGEDNCPDDRNRVQTDQDGDGVGDVCDPLPFIPDNDDAFPALVERNVCQQPVKAAINRLDQPQLVRCDGNDLESDRIDRRLIALHDLLLPQ